MSDFTEANLDLALRWTDGPDDLEGVQVGPAERALIGEGGWIGWPGDPAPGGEGEEAKPQLMVSDAGQAIIAALEGMGRARVPALLATSLIESRQIELPFTIELCHRGYWLVAPLPQWRQKKVRALVAALTAGWTRG